MKYIKAYISKKSKSGWMMVVASREDGALVSVSLRRRQAKDELQFEYARWAMDSLRDTPPSDISQGGDVSVFRANSAEGFMTKCRFDGQLATMKDWSEFAHAH